MDINFEVVRAWASARTGDELALPFFEGKQIDVMVDRTRPVGEFRNVFGAVEGADGGVVLTIGPDEFDGSANLDGRTFRYEHRSGDSSRCR